MGGVEAVACKDADVGLVAGEYLFGGECVLGLVGAYFQRVPCMFAVGAVEDVVAQGGGVAVGVFG